MHLSSLWVLKAMRKAESSLLQLHEIPSEAHRKCCPELVHHSWVTPKHLSPSNWQIWPHRNSFISLQLQYKNKSSLSSAHCRQTELMHHIQKGKSGHKEHNGDWGKLGIRFKAEKWPLLLVAAQWGTSWLSRLMKCTQGQRENKKFLEEMTSDGFVLVLSVTWTGHWVRGIFAQTTGTWAHPGRGCQYQPFQSHRNCPFLATSKAVWSNIFGYLGGWNCKNIHCNFMQQIFFHSHAFPDHASTVVFVNANLFSSF